MSYLNIFKLSLVVDWVLAKKLLEVNTVYTTKDLIYKAIGI
jgi:hypothetical protein